MSKEKEVLEKENNINTEQSEQVQENTAEATPEVKLPSLEEQLAEEKDKYLRLVAEFENFKRRTMKERIELIGSAAKDVILDVLPILDDFDRAIAALSNNEKENKAQLEGMKLIASKLDGILSKKGLKMMECANEVFDADKHEAIANIPAPSEEMKGKIIEVVEKGYLLNDKVIRFAKVVVGN
jgi:molecular chaperone GrpE